MTPPPPAAAVAEMMRPAAPPRDSWVNRDVMAVTKGFSWSYSVLLGLAILGVIQAFCVLAWQTYKGLGIAGYQAPVFWGVYIINFVFWIGIGHAGTLISAILFLFRAKWRNAINRGAEAMTVFAVLTAALFPLIHIGRLWKFYFLIPYPNQRSLCDVTIRIATDADAPVVQALAEKDAGFSFEGWTLDWSHIFPDWIVAEVEGKIVAALQVLPGKPVGRMEILSVDPTLSQATRTHVVKRITDWGVAFLVSQGCDGAMGVIPEEWSSYKVIAERKGWVSISKGDLMLKRLV